MLLVFPNNAKAFSYDISTYPFTTQYDSYIYDFTGDGYGIKPTLYIDGKSIDDLNVSSYVESTDSWKYLSSYLTIEYSNNTDVGTGIITITGKEPFYGTKIVYFTLTDIYTDSDGNIFKIGKIAKNYSYSTDFFGNTVTTKTGYNQTVSLIKYANKKATSISINGRNSYSRTHVYMWYSSYRLYVKNIDSNAFKNAKKIQSISLDNTSGYDIGDLNIEEKAFANKKKLTYIYFGKRNVTLEKNAFKGCKSLKKIKIKSAKYIPTVGKNAFKGCSKNIVIKCPKGAKSKVKKAFKNAGLPKTAKFVY
jgi:hypothetical protein